MAARDAALATGSADEHCGIPGAFLLEVGISSSFHIAKFWGLTGHPRRAVAKRSKPASQIAARARSLLPGATATLAGVREPAGGAPEPASPLHARTIDVHEVITKALRAAGLMKSPWNGVQGQAASYISSVQTLKLTSVLAPKVVLIATSIASRPLAISTRPIRGTLLRGSKVYQLLPEVGPRTRPRSTPGA